MVECDKGTKEGDTGNGRFDAKTEAGTNYEGPYVLCFRENVSYVVREEKWIENVTGLREGR